MCAKNTLCGQTRAVFQMPSCWTTLDCRSSQRGELPTTTATGWTPCPTPRLLMCQQGKLSVFRSLGVSRVSSWSALGSFCVSRVNSWSAFGSFCVSRVNNWSALCQQGKQLVCIWVLLCQQGKQLVYTQVNSVVSVYTGVFFCQQGKLLVCSWVLLCMQGMQLVYTCPFVYAR